MHSTKMFDARIRPKDLNDISYPVHFLSDMEVSRLLIDVAVDSRQGVILQLVLVADNSLCKASMSGCVELGVLL